MLTDTVGWLQRKLQVLFNGVKIPVPADTAAEIGMKAGQEDYRAGEPGAFLPFAWCMQEPVRVCTLRLLRQGASLTDVRSFTSAAPFFHCCKTPLGCLK